MIDFNEKATLETPSVAEDNTPATAGRDRQFQKIKPLLTNYINTLEETGLINNEDGYKEQIIDKEQINKINNFIDLRKVDWRLFKLGLIGPEVEKKLREKIGDPLAEGNILEALKAYEDQVQAVKNIDDQARNECAENFSKIILRQYNYYFR